MKLFSLPQVAIVWCLGLALLFTACRSQNSNADESIMIPTRPDETILQPTVITQSTPFAQEIELFEPALPTPRYQDEITVCLRGEPRTLYMMDSINYEEQLILAAIYDQSTNQNRTYPSSLLTEIPTVENGAISLQPIRIKSGDMVFDQISNAIVNYDGLETWMEQAVITFTLKLNAKWSDGTPITGNDSVYGFNVMADPNTPTEKSLTQMTSRYEAVDAQQIRWTGIPNYFPSDYVKHFIHPLPQHAWNGLSPQELLVSPLSTQYPLGWGPFVVAEWEAGKSLTLEPNPFFDSQVHSPRIVFRFNFNIEDSLPRLLTYRGPDSCDLAILHSVGMPALLTELFQFVKPYPYPFAWVRADFMMENLDMSPTIVAERAMRQAISYTFFASSDFSFSQTWGDVTVGAINDGFVNGMVSQYVFDLTKARNMLHELGWVDDNNDGFLEKDGRPLILRIGLVGDSGGVDNSLTTIGFDVQEFNLTVEQLSNPSTYREALIENGITGLDLIIHQSPLNTLGDCKQFVSSPVSESFEMVEENEFFFLRNVTSLTKYNNSQYDELCRQAWQTIDLRARANFLIQSQSVLVDDVPVIPLATYNTVAFSRYGLVGFQPMQEVLETWNIAEWYYLEDVVGDVRYDPNKQRAFENLFVIGSLKEDVEKILLSLEGVEPCEISTNFNGDIITGETMFCFTSLELYGTDLFIFIFSDDLKLQSIIAQ